MRRIAGVLRALPAEKFTSITGAPSYVAVRTLARHDSTYLYVTNDAPWPVTITLDIEAPVDCAWRGFAHSAEQAGWLDASQGGASPKPGVRRWQARLEPYDVVGGSFLASHVVVLEPHVNIAPEVTEQLAARVRKLWSGLTALQRTSHDVPLADAGFESDAAVEAWRLVGEHGRFQVVRDKPHAGNGAGRLIADEAGATLAAEPARIDAVGRMALSAWLRVPQGSVAPVRLVLEGTPTSDDSAGFYRFATIEGSEAAPLDGQWRQFVFQVHDLPTRQCDRLRVRIELTGPGTLDVDDVRLVDLDFTEAERLQLSKLITLAELKLERGELGECNRLLEGPWARFLTAQAPPATDDAAPLTARRPDQQRRPIAPPPAEPPGMRDRLKKLLPEFLR
ncbi:MAG: hypothetical protein QM775_00060 [Pirellulales bacterium]